MTDKNKENDNNFEENQSDNSSQENKKNIFSKIFECCKRTLFVPYLLYAELKQEQKNLQKIKIEKSFKKFSFETNDENITFKFNFLTKWHKDFTMKSLKLIIFLFFLLILAFFPVFLLENVATLCINCKQYEMAKKIYFSLIKYERFTKHNQDYRINSKYFEKLANVFFLEKDYDSAIIFYQTSLKKYYYSSEYYSPNGYKYFYPKTIPIYIFLGDLYYLKNNKEKQYKMYKNAIDIANKLYSIPKESRFDLEVRKKIVEGVN